MYRLIITSIIIFTFSASSALAYIDPGTGSIILHAILAFIATCFAWIVSKYKEIKLFIKKKFNKKELDR